MADSTTQLTTAQKDELMDQVKQQIAIANAQELLTDMTKKCFSKCIVKPGSSLDSSEQIYIDPTDSVPANFSLQYSEVSAKYLCFSTYEKVLKDKSF